ncbi:hypothetical protein ASPWEDRAFT_168587 [Aspergillus wentii DTO 134E9]|uniref:Uncharacterized protein n=1 Tax=Aspergillus wentii DTO 134E9 TaxID=1073089 RepID=A0A1L9RUS8_ASPWE|nr:uncharacterized protein ASPWEDRAFT_168587 [Aspergillus wentii DTO 134E9]KAI9928614.1 hypothetical protein MW887_001829 [Aspergillus wentii]OJJ38691.1 hypothetical protein ASPWEDRAFT_168587 [Aspergillus wentii DTO 134E9]
MSGSPIAVSWPRDLPDYGYFGPFAQWLDDQLSIPQGLVSQTSATMLPNTASNPMHMGPFSINSFNTGPINHSLAAAGLESNHLAFGSDWLPGGYNMGYGSFTDAQQNIPGTSHSPVYHHKCAVRANSEVESVTQDTTVSCPDHGSEQQKDESTATRWHVGCCVPNSILGEYGYIPMSQAALTSLSLVTDGYCRHGFYIEGLIYLKQLRHFSWRGISWEEEFEIFRSVIQNNACHLTSLQVEVRDIVGWEDSDPHLILCYIGLISTEEVEIPKGFYLPSLRHLSLHRTPVGLWNGTDPFYFDLKKLHSLELNTCRGTPEFMRTMASRKIDLSLRTLHLSDFHDERNANLGSDLASLLTTFSGLEELCVTSDMEFLYLDPDSSVGPFTSHQMTLRRLICRSSDEPEQGMDNNVLGDSFPLLPPLQTLPALELLGIWVEPNFVRAQVGSGRDCESIKLIHFRMRGTYHTPQDVLQELIKSGYPSKLIPSSVYKRCLCVPTEPRHQGPGKVDLYPPDTICLPQLFDFAKWAFGAEGFPNLRVLAYGDFADEGQKWSRILFCRHSGVEHSEAPHDIPFRLVHPDSEHPLADIERARELLYEYQAINVLEGRLETEGDDAPT